VRGIFHATTARPPPERRSKGRCRDLVTLVSIILLGFFLGMRHATDADHVIAVSTIVSRERTLRSAILIGGAWGVGHTLTIVGVGGTIILFSVVIPPRLGLSMEMAVGLMLIVLGLWNLTGILQWLREVFIDGRARPDEVHSHVHSHGDYGHSHPHGHLPGSHGHREEETPQAWLDRRFGRLGAYQVLRPLVVGIVHGLAGSAAIALLVLATIQNAWWATGYLLLFGLGTIAGMMLVTAAIAAPFAFAAQRLGGLSRHLRMASGLLSLGFGLFLVYQIGFVNGLFTGRIHWTPR
jgi:ABC-type nickel/cobalt efflux system permease component RcnA